MGPRSQSGDTHSEELRFKIRIASGRLGELGRRIWLHPRFAELYPRLLVLNHWIVRATVPLMEAAASESERRAPADPVCAALAPYLRAHLEEERGHDEWLVEDLQVLGMDPGDLDREVPSSAAAALVGSQYYWIRHCHPVALMGYMGMLEGNPPSADLVRAAQERTGLPAQAFKTFLGHAALDPGHKADMDRVVDGLPLGPFHRGLVGMSAFQTIHFLEQAWETLLDAPAQLDMVPSGA